MLITHIVCMAVLREQDLLGLFDADAIAAKNVTSWKSKMRHGCDRCLVRMAC